MLWVLWTYDHKGAHATPAEESPAYEEVLDAAADRPTLVLAARVEPDRHLASVLFASAD